MTRWALVAAVLAVLFSVAASHAQIHVSPTGNDTTGNGTPAAPYQTLARALQAPGSLIWLEAGEYILSEPVTIPTGKTVVGGFQSFIGSMNEDFFDASPEETLLLALSTPGEGAITVQNEAELSWVTVVGGFHSVELNPGGRVREVNLRGGEAAALFASEGVVGRAALVERCRITGGSAGIRVEGPANIEVRETLIRGVLGRGMILGGIGDKLVTNTVVRESAGGGILIADAENVTLDGVVVRRNGGDGITVTRSVPVLSNLLVERNESGLSLETDGDAIIRHATIVDNRADGLYLRGARPDIDSSIIAHNGRFGVAEEIESGMQIGGALRNNVFWQNARGAYFDETEDVYTAATDLNGSLVSAGPTTGNTVEDPRFVDRDRRNYRLDRASTLLDRVAPPDDLLLDLDRSPRTEDVPAIGNDGGANLADVGAYELQNAFIRNFGGMNSDDGLVADDAFEGGFQTRKSTPEWEYGDFATFDAPQVDFLPGRIRVLGSTNFTFSPATREVTDEEQAIDEVLVYKATMAGAFERGKPRTRLRANELRVLDMSIEYAAFGDSVIGATPGGYAYHLILDFHQGGYRGLADPPYTTYRPLLSWDIVNLLPILPTHSHQDLTQLRLERYPRDQFLAQFDTEVVSWTFSPDEEFVWEQSQPGGDLAHPRLRYSPSREALEIQQLQDFSFGFWVSPAINLPIGSAYKVDWTVSSAQPTATAPSFRLRANSELFEFTQEHIVLSFAGSTAAVSQEPRVYTTYGLLPNEFSDAEHAQDGRTNIYLFFDLWGFAIDDRIPQGNLYLEDVTVTLAEDPIFYNPEP